MGLLDGKIAVVIGASSDGRIDATVETIFANETTLGRLPKPQELLP